MLLCCCSDLQASLSKGGCTRGVGEVLLALLGLGVQT
jgi:hypothetical protein